MLNSTLRRTNQKKTTNTEIMLGYSKEQLKGCLEGQFIEGMSWLNHGKWHIDHIKPVSVFVKEGITDPKIINALSNLQPLWAFDNISKGDKWEGEEND